MFHMQVWLIDDIKVVEPPSIGSDLAIFSWFNQFSLIEFNHLISSPKVKFKRGLNRLEKRAHCDRVY